MPLTVTIDKVKGDTTGEWEIGRIAEARSWVDTQLCIVRAKARLFVLLQDPRTTWTAPPLSGAILLPHGSSVHIKQLLALSTTRPVYASMLDCGSIIRILSGPYAGRIALKCAGCYLDIATAVDIPLNGNEQVEDIMEAAIPQ